MSEPRRLGERELNLINLYAYWELELEPQTFYAKWDVTYEQIALICGRSPATVQHWFQTGKNYHSPSKYDKRYLALRDFVLEHFEEIPAKLLDQLCWRNRGSGRRL
jgi:hypothetical protein